MRLVGVDSVVDRAVHVVALRNWSALNAVKVGLGGCSASELRLQLADGWRWEWPAACPQGKHVKGAAPTREGRAEAAAPEKGI